MSAALWIDWKVAVSFWSLSECVWMLRRAGKGLERKFGCWVNSLKKWVQVFVVRDLVCGELEG